MLNLKTNNVFEFSIFFKYKIVEKKINILLLSLGIFMIIVAILNYLMSNDYASLGIFVFSGVGFILLSLKNYFKKENKKRFEKYAQTFFLGAAIIFVYWIVKVKLNIF